MPYFLAPTATSRARARTMTSQCYGNGMAYFYNPSLPYILHLGAY